MDTQLRRLERAAKAGDTQAKERYTTQLNRLIEGGCTDTLMDFHWARTETQTAPKVSADDMRSRRSVEFLSYMFVMAADHSSVWNASELAKDDTAYLRIYMGGPGVGDRMDDWGPWYMCHERTWRGDFCAANVTERNTERLCENCQQNRRHCQSVARLILARKSDEPTFVSFDETNPTHGCDANEFDSDPYYWDVDYIDPAFDTETQSWR